MTGRPLPGDLLFGLAADDVNSAPGAAAVLELHELRPDLTWVVGEVGLDGIWLGIALIGQYAEFLAVGIPYSDTLIPLIDEGVVPAVVLDLPVEEHADEAAITRDFTIGCHVAVLVKDAEGRPAITISGLDSEPRSVDDLTELLPLMRDLATAMPQPERPADEPDDGAVGEVRFGLAADIRNSRAASAVVREMRTAAPLLSWVVGQVVGDTWTGIALVGDGFLEVLGVEVPFRDTLLALVEDGRIPPVLADVHASDDAEAAPVTRDFTLGCHVAVLGHDAGGHPTVSISGIASQALTGEDLDGLLPRMLELVGTLPPPETVPAT